MHKIPSFNASCFVMVSFSYVTAKKGQISYASHWLVPNEPTRQKFVQRGLKRKNLKISVTFSARKKKGFNIS